MKIKVQAKTSAKVRSLVYNLLDVFQKIGIPVDGTDRKVERMAKACLAVGKIKKSFAEALSEENDGFVRTRDIISFENENYGEHISPGSYDDIRRKDLKLLIEAGIVINSSSRENLATNNPSRGYALSKSFVELLYSYGSEEWDMRLSEYLKEAKSLKEELECRRNLMKVPVTLPGGKRINLSYGAHNDLQKEIIETFLPLFGFGAEVLYVGDTTDKFLHLDEKALKEINFFVLEHDELPDVVAYSHEKNLLYLIEAYHSTGEWNEIRVRKVKRKLKESGCTADVVFFTAFETKNAFKQKAKDIAWETEVWIAESPEHLVHFNGYKFLDIHK